MREILTQHRRTDEIITLTLATSRRYFGFGDSNDYVVIDGGRAIGRIMLHPQAQEAMVLDDHRGGAPTIRL